MSHEENFDDFEEYREDDTGTASSDQDDIKEGDPQQTPQCDDDDHAIDNSIESSSGAPNAYAARNKSFARRGRHMSDALQRTLDEYGKKYIIDVPRGDGPTAVAEDAKPLAYRKIFDRKAVVRVEIGSGVGTQIVAAAQSHPKRDYLAFEVYRPGIAKTINKAEAAGGLSNLKLIEADAAQALRILLPEASVDEVWTFFPDPWRKTRHHKRRLIQEEFARDVAYVLRPGGLWRIATDWDDYAWEIRDLIEESAYFENPYTGVNPDPNDPQGDRGGFAPRWDNRVMTKFEHRGIEAGRTIHDIIGQRL